jgi:serine/threonine protein phosphatase 1
MIFQKIQKTSKGSRWAIGDVHGCAKTLKKLIEEKISLNTDDQLFMLGDYINRGPDSWGVIQYLMGLKARGYAVYCLRGNHEVMLLNFLNEDITSEIIRQIELNIYLKIPENQQDKGEEAFRFLNSLPYYFELDDYWLVHGGINFNLESPFENYLRMPWIRRTPYDNEKARNKKVIHGHTVHNLSKIMQAIDNQSVVIPLDAGCYQGYHKTGQIGETGYLCAFNLDNGILKTQICID